MAEGQLNPVLRHVRRMAGDTEGRAEASDRELLQCFLARHEEAVFAALVRRHGPTVLGVCRRVLGHEQDAEDAFQATFLVLARKAGSIRKHASLGSWLYGVAYRLARKARVRAARRRAHERRAAAMGRTAPESDTAADLRPILDEELARLPEKYRAPLVLCYLEGKTHVEAARVLGWPPGSLAKRLARARELLRVRLVGRGLALPAAGVAALLGDSARAAVSDSLLHTSARAAVLVATGEAAAGVVSVQALTLAEGALRTMFLTRLKITLGISLVFLLGGLAAGVGWTARPAASVDPPNLPAQAAAEEPAPAERRADETVVPADAVAFARLAVRRLWDSAAMKAAERQMGPAILEPLREAEKSLGVSLADLDVITLIVLPPAAEPPAGAAGPTPLVLPPGSRQPPPGAGEPPPAVNPGPAVLAAYTTTKPYDRARVQRAVTGPGQREPSVHFLSDRTFVVADPPVLRRYLRMDRRPAEQGGLHDALKLAAGNHPLAAGFWLPEAVAAELKREPLPPVAQFLAPLLEAKSGTLVMDLNRQADFRARVRFADETAARTARHATETGMDMLRRLLAEHHAGDALEQAWGKEVAAALRTAHVSQQENTLQLTLEANGVFFVGNTLPALQQIRASAKRVQSTNNLKQIALAMMNYADAFHRLPPAALTDDQGRPVLSWRVAILPFIEQDALYKEFKLDEPWDSPHNKKLLGRMPTIYQPTGARTAKPYTTYYQGFTGKGTVFEPNKEIRLPTDIPDGMSNTILVVEAGEPVPWTKPQDLPFNPTKPLPKLDGPFPDRFLAAFCDGSVHFLPKNIDPQLLRALITRNGGETVQVPSEAPNPIPPGRLATPTRP